MASNTDFVQYIADQCSGAGEITTRKMMGDYCIYCNGKVFGLICDDCFFIKPTEQVKSLLREVELRPPYDGAKDYFYIADVDDHEYLSMLTKETCRALPEPKKKKTPKKQHRTHHTHLQRGAYDGKSSRTKRKHEKNR